MSGWKVDDTEPALSGTALNGATPQTLAAALAVTIHVQKPSGDVIDRAAVLANQTTDPGKWSLPWVTGDLDEPGLYQVELQVEWSTGRIQTFPGDRYGQLYVTRELA